MAKQRTPLEKKVMDLALHRHTGDMAGVGQKNDVVLLELVARIERLEQEVAAMKGDASRRPPPRRPAEATT